MLSLNEWLSLFNHRSSYSDFLLNGKVRKYNGVLVALPIDDNNTLFLTKIINILENKNTFLTEFYNRNLKVYDKPINTLCLNNGKYSKYKNIVRNTYYKEILQTTKTIQPYIRSYLDVLLDLFNELIIDYKLITPSAKSMILNNKFKCVLSAYFFKASIMNPIIPYTLSVSYTDNKFKVFTPTLGWSSYLIGMLNNPNMEEYVGVDVIQNVCIKTEEFALNKVKNKIYCSPSEELFYDKSFMDTFVSYFDFIFFSPPYYQLELYEEGKQSTNTYKTYDEWLNKYWDITMKLCYSVLKVNKYMVYIVSGYSFKKKYINLEDDLISITIKNGFILVNKLDMGGNNIDCSKHRKLKESIYIFMKID